MTTAAGAGERRARASRGVEGGRPPLKRRRSFARESAPHLTNFTANPESDEGGNAERACRDSGGDHAALVELVKGSRKPVSKSPKLEIAPSYAPLKFTPVQRVGERVASAPQGAVIGLFTLRFCDTAQG